MEEISRSRMVQRTGPNRKMRPPFLHRHRDLGNDHPPFLHRHRDLAEGHSPFLHLLYRQVCECEVRDEGGAMDGAGGLGRGFGDRSVLVPL